MYSYNGEYRVGGPTLECVSCWIYCGQPSAQYGACLCTWGTSLYLGYSYDSVPREHVDFVAEHVYVCRFVYVASQNALCIYSWSMQARLNSHGPSINGAVGDSAFVSWWSGRDSCGQPCRRFHVGSQGVSRFGC